MGALVAPSEDCYLVDSMPLEICKFGRAKRLSICREADASSPDYGYCAVHRTHYFGYKFHAVCTSDGIVLTFDISKASKHDIHYLNDLQAQLSHCVLVGDKGYLSRQWQHDLFDTAAIRLETPIPKGHKCAGTNSISLPSAQCCGKPGSASRPFSRNCATSS